jgi:hypothetical protein
MNTKNTRSSPKKFDDERRQPKTKDPEIKAAVILGIFGIVAALITSPLWVPLLVKHSDIRNSHTLIQQHSQGEETKVEFSPITLQSYLKQIGDPNLTDLQREKFLQEHLGRRVEWEGYIRQVAKGVDLPERAYIVGIIPNVIIKCALRSREGRWTIDERRSFCHLNFGHLCLFRI